MRTKNGVERLCVTKDIGAGGVFFYCQPGFAVGSLIEVVMVLPPELTGGENQWVCAHAKVVRLENPSSEGGQHGVAATIERLEFLPELDI